MRVLKITPVCFKSKIIDSHAHIGSHEGSLYTKGSLDVYVKNPLPNGDTVEKMIVSDLDVLHGVKDELQGNLETKQVLEKDSHYAILASCNPKTGNIENIKKLFAENPNSFAGLKFHPTFMEINPDDIRFKPYLEFAEQNNLPCLFHTAVNTNADGRLAKEIEAFSDPEYIYSIAKKYPKTPFVMAHLGAGSGESHDKTIEIMLDSVKNKDANLYADISWVDIDSPVTNGHSSKDHIVKAIKKLKGIDEPNWKYGDQSYRLMYGTDVPLSRFHDWYHPEALSDYAKFADDIKFAVKSDKILASNAEQILEDLFYNNAEKLYLNTKKIRRI